MQRPHQLLKSHAVKKFFAETSVVHCRKPTTKKVKKRPSISATLKPGSVPPHQQFLSELLAFQQLKGLNIEAHKHLGVDPYTLFCSVTERGGCENCTSQNLWTEVATLQGPTAVASLVKKYYMDVLFEFDKYRTQKQSPQLKLVDQMMGKGSITSRAAGYTYGEQQKPSQPVDGLSRLTDSARRTAGGAQVHDRMASICPPSLCPLKEGRTSKLSQNSARDMDLEQHQSAVTEEVTPKWGPDQLEAARRTKTGKAKMRAEGNTCSEEGHKDKKLKVSHASPDELGMNTARERMKSEQEPGLLLRLQQRQGREKCEKRVVELRFPEDRDMPSQVQIFMMAMRSGDIEQSDIKLNSREKKAILVYGGEDKARQAAESFERKGPARFHLPESSIKVRQRG